MELIRLNQLNSCDSFQIFNLIGCPPSYPHMNLIKGIRIAAARNGIAMGQMISVNTEVNIPTTKQKKEIFRAVLMFLHSHKLEKSVKVVQYI
ncbi:MAG: hypothetical protein ABI337_05365 [Nitrososphaera sp.]